MNLLDQAKHIPNGIVVIGKWLGSGGEVVGQEVAQERADTCLKCPENVSGLKLTESVALAVKQFLSVKNQIGLRVGGERRLGTCNMCGCVLRLKIWEPQERVRAELSDEERAKAPDYCWQTKL